MPYYITRGILIILLAAFFCIGTLAFIFEYRNDETFHLSLQMLLFTALSAVANMFLSFIAFWQLPQIEKTSRAAEITTRGQFVISLNEQWMQADVLAARCHIHELALTHRGPNMEHAMAQSIHEIAEDPAPENVKKFAQIISLIEFMETLGTLYRHNHISLIVIEQLFGGSIERYHFYLRPYIQHRRDMGSPSGIKFYSDQFLYQAFYDLVDDLKHARKENV